MTVSQRSGIVEGGGMEERLVECSFLIPLVRDSDRTPHPIVAWWRLVEAIRTLFPEGHSGPELMYRDVKVLSGEYVDDATGRIVRDESRRYTVAIPRSRLEDLRKFLRGAANTFDQKAIYLAVAGEVEFVKSKPWDGAL